MTEFSGHIGPTRAESTPWWPDLPAGGNESPDIVVILFDDVGFSDFGCYGSEISTPNIYRLAAGGLRYTGFHTTAMCSPTRASLLTGRNHHAVGMGCLANFDSGFPGYRGKIAKTAGTIAEMLRPHGWNNYMIGKWHVTPLTETGHGGPFDGWPLQRGFDRFYGFLDAETDQYTPALVADNTQVEPPRTPDEGYFLTEDLVDRTILNLRNQRSVAPESPSFSLLAFGACHAPHQAPRELIEAYDEVFAKGWDVTRDERLERQISMGIVPSGTRLPPRNDFVSAWTDHSADERRVFTRLQAAYAAMLHHADSEIGRLIDAIEAMGRLDETLIIVLSDNGASQEGGPLGFVNAMGPFNGRPEEMAEKLARIDEIGGPNTHSNFPWGWSMAANTPLKRYKQNTHGGGIRDPLVIHWPAGLSEAGGLRHQFCHVSDLTPTILDLVGVSPPESISGVDQQPVDGVSFAPTLHNADAPSQKSSQYFEMFGHRGLWADGWKAVAYHQSGSDFDDDQWELYNLDEDFAEIDDLAKTHPDRLTALKDQWWADAAEHKVLPLDDRFGPRFAENAARHQPTGHRFTFWSGMGHLPTDVAPDVRGRSYRVVAHVAPVEPGTEGVLLAHGDDTSGYCLYVRDGNLVHDINIGGTHHVVTSEGPIEAGATTLGIEVDRSGDGPGRFTLLVDDRPVGSAEYAARFITTVSWEGLDIGCDRLSPVGNYEAPFVYTGRLFRVEVELDTNQNLDYEAVARTELGRQ